jgi:glycosyltransferase involved in cell wall biosynthesis
MTTEQMPTASRRVTVVADEMLGHTRTGGLGTATTFLALALGRMGHEVEFLYVGDRPSAPMAAEWAGLYEQARVRIRFLPQRNAVIEPGFLERAYETELALAADPPEIVVAQELAAPAYTSLRMRQLGLGFDNTLFVVYCHGGRRWITDTARKVRVLPGAHAVTLLEQACVELADVVVSPSEYLLEWMQQQGWQLPATAVAIPYLTRAAATGEPGPERAPNGTRVERIAFFGRLEERKGLKQFAAGLNALGPDLLRAVELEFLGRATPAWPPERVEALLSDQTKRALRKLSFATNLDQTEALTRLSRPGTLAVMPSLGETFSNAVYECLERGIPFVASDAGAPRELVADDDRSRVLFEPTPAGIAAALRRTLVDTEPLRPARPAFDARAAYERWADVIDMRPQARMVPSERPTADDDWILLVDEGDKPDPELSETLHRAQAASGADVVTCGVRVGTTQRLFLGDPGGLGVLENHYGAAAVIRRSLSAVEGEALWPLLARLALEGARIVSIPRALVERGDTPEEVESRQDDALTVAQRFEERLPHELRSLARLAAGLGAAAAASTAPRRSLHRRIVERIARR